MNYKIGVIIPTYKPSLDFIHGILIQNYKPNSVLVIDSDSPDLSEYDITKHGFKFIRIKRESFNHGGTRNFAISQLSDENDIVIFLTQDAILDDSSSFENIVKYFGELNTGAVCGRQIPHNDANPIAIHSRLFNYPDFSYENSKDEIKLRGMKTAYMSNSFAAYRLDAYNKCGGFPEDLIFGEDMYLSAKMIIHGFKTFYCADAVVRHSHNYSLLEEFRRYFDIGVFHRDQPFLIEKFGKPKGEGLKYAISEFNYCLNNNIYWAVRSLLGTGIKFLGYNLGYYHHKIPKALKKKFSMHKSYWLNK